MKTKEEFMKDLYVTCNKCGYNNRKDRLENYGTCLLCGEIIDKKIYFKVMMRKMSMKNPKARGRRGLHSCLYF